MTRQFALFMNDNCDLVTQARAELTRYHDESDPDFALEHYARFDDLCEDIEDFLIEMRDSYMLRLEDRTSRRYEQAFNRRVRSTFGDLVPRRSAD